MGEAAGDDVEYVEVCAEDELSDGDKIGFDIDGTRVLLARVAGRYYAISGVCTHERAFLDEGAVVDNVVYCPRHYSAFDLRTGSVLGPPADAPAPTYGVRVENGAVLVSVVPVATAAEPDPEVLFEPVPEAASAQQRLFERIDALRWLHRAADGFSAVATPVRGALAPRGVLDLLHGRWFGHALHPALSDLPIGFWAGSVLLFVFGFAGPAVLLSVAGLVAAVVAVVTGLADVTVTDGPDRRLGVLHGLIMSAAFVVQLGTPIAYLAGSSLVAGLLAAVSLLMTLAGAFLGGHLVLGRGAMVDHTVWPPRTAEWSRAVQVDDLQAGSTATAAVDGRTVLLYRSPSDGSISAIEDACSHASGPLSLGRVCEGVVSCPWHDSAFRLRDGAVVRGPATFPQPALEVRVAGDWIEVRPRAAR